MKETILLILIFTSILAAESSDANSNKVANRTLAFCWQSKDQQWWCDGPDQILWSSEETLKSALKRSGCETYSKTIAWAGDSKLGHLFFCNKKYSKFDRDIREKYNIKGY